MEGMRLGCEGNDGEILGKSTTEGVSVHGEHLPVQISITE